MSSRWNYGGHWIRPNRRLAIYLRDQFRCVYCGNSAKDKGALPFWSKDHKPRLPLDHVVPRSQGGGHENTNLVTCCQRCNELKGNRDVADWLAARVAMGELTGSEAVAIAYRADTQRHTPVNTLFARALREWLELQSAENERG